ncbi:MAG: sel1 repeat family protein [Alphaproteobacteria bacterium]|nr:sel1 repeat family protein [Alphaproteobacteria bacterium]
MEIIFSSSGVFVSDDPAPEGKPTFEGWDQGAAVPLLRPLAVAGKADAQASLGVMYEIGLGVPQNFDEALKWYRLAADQNHVDALFNLGGMHREGRGRAAQRCRGRKLPSQSR